MCVEQCVFVLQCLPDPNNYHEFCRLLARLKSNYQLGELVKVENYPEVIRLIANFTVTSLQVGFLTFSVCNSVCVCHPRLKKKKKKVYVCIYSHTHTYIVVKQQCCVPDSLLLLFLLSTGSSPPTVFTTC